MFFAAGSLICLKEKGFGIIFMFSHGFTGLGIMMAGLIGGLISSPLMGDAPIYILIFLVIIALLILAAMVLIILYNLSDILKAKRNFIFIPLILFGTAILLALILSKMVTYRYGIQSSLFMIS